MNQANGVGLPTPKDATGDSGRHLVLLGVPSLYHTALKYLIESQSSHQVFASAMREDEALQAVVKTDADLVLLDLDLDSVTEARVREISLMLEKLAPRPVLLISAGIEPDALQRLLRQGLAGVVLKTSYGETLLQAIEAACNGKVWLQRDVLMQTFADGSHARRPCSQSATIAGLTPRERGIITAACAGLTSRQIGERLLISEATVRHHLSSIFAKLGVATRGELIVFAYRHHLADDHGSDNVC